MNILLINQYAGSPRMGMELRPFEMARAWTLAGDTATVLAGDISHLRRQNPDVPYDGACWREGSVAFYGLRTPYYRGNGIRRAANVACFSRKLRCGAARIARELHPQVVIASSTHPFDFFGARAIAKRSNAALIFELHDLWPLSPMELYGFSPHHPLMRLIDTAETTALTESDAVVSLLPYADRYLEQREMIPKRYLHLPNGVRIQTAIAPPGEHLARLDALHRRFGFVVLYAGGFSEANAVETFAALSRMLPQVGFAAIGDGPLRTRLTQTARAENLVFLDCVLPGALPALLRRADLLWMGTRDLRMYQYGLAMNKLFEYLLAGRPVLLASSCASNPVSMAHCGETVEPRNLFGQACAVMRFRAYSTAERDAMGENGQRYVREHHNIETIAAKYRLLLEELIDAKKT